MLALCRIADLHVLGTFFEHWIKNSPPCKILIKDLLFRCYRQSVFSIMFTPAFLLEAVVSDGLDISRFSAISAGSVDFTP